MGWAICGNTFHTAKVRGRWFFVVVEGGMYGRREESSLASKENSRPAVPACGSYVDGAKCRWLKGRLGEAGRSDDAPMFTHHPCHLATNPHVGCDTLAPNLAAVPGRPCLLDFLRSRVPAFLHHYLVNVASSCNVLRCSIL